MLLLIILKTALSRRNSSPEIKAGSYFKSRVIEYLSDSPLFMISDTIFLIKGHFLQAFFVMAAYHIQEMKLNLNPQGVFLFLGFEI